MGARSSLLCSCLTKHHHRSISSLSGGGLIFNHSLRGMWLLLSIEVYGSMGSFGDWLLSNFLLFNIKKCEVFDGN